MRLEQREIACSEEGEHVPATDDAHGPPSRSEPSSFVISQRMVQAQSGQRVRITRCQWKVSLRRCEKVWEGVGRCESVWEGVRRCEKV